MKQTILSESIRKVKQKVCVRRYNSSERGKAVLRKAAKKYYASHLPLKTISFIVFSDREEEWSYNIKTTIQENENFHHKGVFSDFKHRKTDRLRTGRNKEKELMKWRRHYNKRRGLGFSQCNNRFDGAEAHHINKECVLWIPRELHQSVQHNLLSGKNMNEINTKAITWVVNGGCLLYMEGERGSSRNKENIEAS